MNWKDLLASGTVRTYKTRSKEIEGLRQLIACDLADALHVHLGKEAR